MHAVAGIQEMLEYIYIYIIIIRFHNNNIKGENVYSSLAYICWGYEIHGNPWEHIEYILKIQQGEVNKLEFS